MKSDLQKIKEAIKNRGIKRSFIAKRANISPSYFTLMLQSQRPMMPHHKERIFQALDIK